MTDVSWKTGKQGMASAHRSVLEDRPSHSLDLDRSFAQTRPQSSRWDYLLRRNAGTFAAVEVHAAKDGEVGAMIAKKRWAEGVLGEISHPTDRVRRGVDSPTRWHWVATGSSVSMSRTGRSRRLLASNGIEFPTRRILAGRL